MINLPSLVRLTPLAVTVTPEGDLPAQVQALESQTVGAAFDRDTTSLYTPYGNDLIRVGFEGMETISRLRFYGPSPCRLSASWDDGTGKLTAIAAWTNVDLSGMAPGWNSLDLAAPVSCASLVLSLAPETPTAASGNGLSEMEFWGQGWAQNQADGGAWDAWLNSSSGPSSLMVSGREYLGAPGSPTDSGVVTIGGSAGTGSFTVNLPMAGNRYRRMWLVYDVDGLSNWIAVPRTINGQEAAGGWPLPGSGQWCTEVEALHPAWMNAGPNSVVFSMPNGTVNPYEVRNLKVVAEEDDGANLVDGIDASAGDASVLLDGDETTGWKPYVDGEGGGNPTPSLTLRLYRSEQLDSIRLYLVDALGGQVVESVRQNGAWLRLGDVTNGKGLGSGWQSLPVSVSGAVDAVILEFRGGDGSPGEIMEAMAQGSGVGKAYGQTIEVTYPTAGQFFGTEAYIRGFLGQADDGSGQAQVMLGSQPAQVMNGQFEGIVSMDQLGVPQGSASWAVTVTAIYPDGVQLMKVIPLGQQVSGGTGSGQGTYAQMLNTGQATVLNQLGAQLSVSANALTGRVNLQMVPLSTTDLEPLNPGMTNVTGGNYRGYRFLPHGTHFNSEVKVSLPFDPAMLPNGKTVADVRTFYFDTNRGMWEPLPLSSVDSPGQMLTSLTTHFTDFINATITVPDTPQESNFNPTQLNGIQAANPAAQINQIEPPGANNQGTANLDYPVEVPPGRHGLEPDLEVKYDSSEGDSWMGVGWDLSCPQITVETRWGAPRYSGSQETEDYLLDGEPLVMFRPPGSPGVTTYLAHRMSGSASSGITFLARQNSGPVTFHTRTEGEFQRIIRYGGGPSSYTWEVDEKDGTRFFYGGKSGSVHSGSPESGTSDPAVLTAGGGNTGNIFLWALREAVDLHGNCVVYHYDFAADNGGSELYPSSIAYTGTQGSDGPYRVSFYRLGATTENGNWSSSSTITSNTPRGDIANYAKGGFVRATADVLDHIDVTLNGSLVRRYGFTYTPGAFSKTLLSSIRQFGSAGEPFPGSTHSFTYYNDLDPGNTGTYAGFAPATQWSSPALEQLNNSVSPAVNMSSPLLPINGIDTTETDGGSGHIYVGYAPPFDEDKYESAGFKVGLGGSDCFGKLTLMDVNGDGLPDLVYQGTDGSYYYLANQSTDGSSYSFSSTPQRLQNLNGISHDSNFNLTVGVENYIAVQALYDVTTQWDTQSVYFTDVNGDGIPDLVDNGQVYFGSVDPVTGTVSYSMTSGGTPNPLGASQAVTLPVDLSMVVTEAANDPLVDNLTQWTAPYDGVVTITAPVTLLPSPSPTAGATPSTTPDGVRVLLEKASGMPSFVPNQHLGGFTLGSAQAGQGQALSALVTVGRGDRIYFRLQSIFNGANDAVAWDPQIQYQSFTGTGASVAGPVPDENGLDAASYQPSRDFTLAGLRAVTVTLPLSGTVSIGGDFHKLGPTTDDLTVLLVKTTYSGTTVVAGPVTQGVTIVSGPVTEAAESSPATLWAQTVAAQSVTTLSMPASLSAVTVSHVSQAAVSGQCTPTSAVTQVDQLELYVKSDTNIDLSQINWQPTLYYTALASPTPNPCTGVAPKPVTANFPVIPLAYQQDFYPENSESPVDGAPQAALTVAAPAVTLTTPPAAPTPPTPTATPTGTPSATASPIPTAIPAGDGVLYMNGTLQVNGALGNAVTLAASVNGTTVFTQTVTPGATPGPVTVQGELSGLVKAGDQLLLSLGAGTTTDLGNLSWSPALYYVNPYANDAPLTGAGAVTYKPDYEVALGIGAGGGPVTQVHYILVPQITMESAVFPSNLASATTVLASIPHGDLAFTIKQPPNRLYKSTVDISPANWGPPTLSNSFATTTLLGILTLTTTVTQAPVQVAPVTLLENLGQVLYFNFTVSDEIDRSNMLAAKLSSGSIPNVPFSFDSPGNYPEQFGAGGAPVSLEVTPLPSPFVPVTVAVLNSNQPVSMTFPAAYRGWAYGGVKNDPALQGTAVTGPSNGSESNAPLAESNLEIPSISQATTQIVQPTVTGTATAVPVTVVLPPSMDGVFYYPGAVTFANSGGTTSIFNAWCGPSTAIYAAAATVSSSRLLRDALFIPTASSGTVVSGGSLSGVPSRKSFELNGVAGFGFSFVSGSYTVPSGAATCQQDYLDLNGDGYPDILNGGSVTYTNPTGNFSPDNANLPLGIIRTSGNTAGNFGIGGNPADPDLDAKGRGGAGGGGGEQGQGEKGGGGGAGGKGGGKNSMQPLGSLGLAFGTSTQNVDLIDMNGDGLPDQVTTDGAGHLLVYLNLGYGFAATPVTWTNLGGTSITSINQSSSLGINGGVGFNDGIYGYAGGASAEADFSSSEFEFVDLNGDGLPDLVWDGQSSQGTWLVQFNTGSGFTAPVTWTGAYVPVSLPNGLNDVESTIGNSSLAGTLGVQPFFPPTTDLETNFSFNIGGGGYFTIPISLAIFGTIIINPGFDVSATSSEQWAKLIDMKGSGYLDQMVSTSDGSVTLFENQTGRTNLLQTVNRPMGSAFTLDYALGSHSYADPNPHWDLVQVALYDGGQNNNTAKGGADWQVSRLAYGGGVTASGAVTATTGGYYDRFDREFLGYAAVTETEMDTRGYAGTSAPDANHSFNPYRRTARRYLNANLYEKGLLVGETTEDVSGGSPATFVDENFQYQLWDVAAGAAGPSLPTAGILLANSILFPQLTEKDMASYEPGSAAPVTTFMTYAYDALGNTVTYVDGGNGATDAVTATASYANTDASFPASLYFTGLPEAITVTGASGILRERQAVYDPQYGDLTEVRRSTGSTGPSSLAVDDMAYDSTYGHLISETGPANATGQRYQRTYQYDTVVQSYPVFTQDSFGYTSTESYDYRFGKPSVDVDENNNRIQWFYDDFGRMVTVIGPFETASGHFTLAFDYHPTAAVPYAHTAHFDPFRGANATMDTVLFTDGVEKTIQTNMTSTVFQGAAQKALDETIASGRVVFDQVGRVIQEYYPVTETGTSAAPATAFNAGYDTSAQPTSITFDVLGRPVSTFYPDQSFEGYTYTTASLPGILSPATGFLTTLVDQDGNKKQEYQDAKGLTAEVLEYPSSGTALATQYQYDPIRELTRVTDAKGNVTSAEYDALGRRTVIQNLDTGKTTLTYDPASNLVQKVTANLAKENKAISYGYQYDRLQSVTYPDFPRNNVTYSYGGPGASLNQAGRMAQVTDASGSQSFAYDALGNSVTETRILQVPNGSWAGEGAWDKGTLSTSPVTYVTSFLWDDWGRVQQMAYPDGEVLTYQYDSGGKPRAVAGIVPAAGSGQSSTGTSAGAGVLYPYVTRLEYDRFGDRAFQQNGNGTQETYSYRPDNRRLLQLTTASQGATFQNLNYSYDKVGNVLGLNNNAPAGGNGLAGPVTQGFRYDGLYRLTQASGLYSGAFNTSTGQGFNSHYSLALAYDNIHNIVRKNQSVQEQVQGQGFQPDNGLTYDWTYQYQGAQPHAPTGIGTRTFTYDGNGNQAGFTDLSGTPRTIVWDEDNQMEGVEDGAGALSDGGIRFTYDDTGARSLKIDHFNKMVAYPNQFYTVENPLAGINAQADKHIFVEDDRIATHMVSGPTTTTGPPSLGSTSTIAQWIGSWGVSIAQGNTDAANFGSPGNFVTVEQDGVQVLGAPQIWTKGVQVLGTANSCQILTLLNPKPQGGYFQVSFNNQPGYLPVNAAVVGIPLSCFQTSTSQNTSIMPKNNFVFFYHDDHLGSTGYLTDQNGNLSEHLEYLPFGETWTQQDRGTQIFPDYEFTGKELDTETGLYYFGARYYDPRISLWQSPDPGLGDFFPENPEDKDLPGEGGVYLSQNLSLYSYAHANPLVVTDPDGAVPYKKNKKLKTILKKVKTSSGRINEVTWLFDTLGRPVQVRGKLRALYGYPRNDSATLRAYRKKYNTDPDDDAGHPLGFRFIGDQGMEVLFDQQKNFNRGAYRKEFENQMAVILKTNSKNEVDFDIVLKNYGKKGRRPRDVLVSYKPKKGSKKKVVFKNKKGGR